MKLNGSALVYTGLAAIAIAAISFVALKPTAGAETRDFFGRGRDARRRYA